MSRLRWSALLTVAAAVLSLIALAPAQTKPASAPASAEAATYTLTMSATTAANRADPISNPQAQFVSDLHNLVSNHRLAGFKGGNEADSLDGSLAAGEYVKARLEGLGFKQETGANLRLFLQDFPIVQSFPTECTLEADGKTVNIQPLRPNVFQAVVTPPEGLNGKTLYAGGGTLAEYGTELPQGRIVVLDFDCENRWLDAFALGAQAVIFIGSDAPAAVVNHYVLTPSNLPRFYVTAQQARELELATRPRMVKLVSKSHWGQATGRNVIAVLRGTNPKFSTDADAVPQALLLAAPLDSYGEVPLRSPGTRDAANCAALLNLAQYLRENRPRRDVILCFFDAQALHHMGARAFYAAAFRGLPGVKADSLDKVRQSIEKESRFRQEVLDVLQRLLTSLDSLAQRKGPIDDLAAIVPQDIRKLDRYDDVNRILKEAAKVKSALLMEDLRPLRIDMESLKYKARALPDASPQRVQIQQDMAKIEDDANALQKLDDGWNWVQRAVHFQALPEKGKNESDAELASKHAVVLAMTRDLTAETIALQHRRLDELAAAYARNDQDWALREELGAGHDHIALHLSMNLSDARTKWGFIHGEDSGPLHKDTVGNYGSVFKAIRAVAQKVGTAGFYPQTVSQNFDSRMYAPGLFADSSVVARSFGFFNLALMTVFDRTPRQGQPCDTLEALNVENFQDQARQLSPFLKALADTPDLDLTPAIGPDAQIVEPVWAGNKSAGPTILGSGSVLQARPAMDVLVAVLTGHWSILALDRVPPGFVPMLYCKTDTNGNFAAGPYSINSYNGGKPIVWGARPDDNGLFRSVTGSLTAQENLGKASVSLFRCLSKTIVGYGFDRGSTTMIMREIPESATAFPTDRSLGCEVGNLLTLFAPYDAKGMKIFNSSGAVILHNADTPQEYLGDGISLRQPFEHPDTLRYTAHDLRIINEYRLKLLRSVRIHQGSLEVLQGEAKEIEERASAQLDAFAAGKADANATLDKPMGDLAAATTYSRGTYGPLVSVINDLVTAVVLLLLLAMPFAFSLERLLIGTPHIYRQIAWFALFFLLTFGVLYLVNPAFRIASTPVIIFLAFTIILLSTLVIFIMVRKLQAEIRKTQGLALTVHSADVSRLSTMMAAVNMGISTMRRRPVRTVLTAATVVLLTFTILTFASFGSEYGVRTNYVGPMGGGDARILVRQQLWSPLSDTVLDTLRGHFAAEANVVPRYWIAPTAADAKTAAQNNTDLRSLMTLGNPDLVMPFSAAIGINAIDIRRQQLTEHFDGKLDLLAQGGVFISDAYRKALGLVEADVGAKTLLVYGYPMVYAGVMRPTFASAVMLEGSSLLPVDYQSSSGDALATSTATTAVTEASDVQSHQFVNYSPDEVVVMSDDAARRMGGKIRSITLYPLQAQQISDLGQQTAKIVKLPTYVGEGGGVSRMYFTTLTSASGWRDLLIPVLLGGMIIFATMLGSVSDREREIYTFSSLGLAPPHVASLFFAEAAVYAVTGGMGGYLLGQIVARLLAWLSGIFNFSVPTMNYSSTNAIVTILIVMATVLISTIYPAMKASRSANPGIQRAWRIPNPVNNLYDLVFPFTVSAYDILGVVTFLKEHFDNYSDTSLGVFATSDTAVFRQEGNNMLGLRSTVALAPFDLGVNQKFAMLSQPSDIEGIDEVRIMIYRLSGAAGDWQRANRVFVNDLRKQLLIWRSLPTEVTDRYRQKTLESLSTLPVEQIDATTIGEAP